jgi:hypothetical protein
MRLERGMKATERVITVSTSSRTPFSDPRREPELAGRLRKVKAELLPVSAVNGIASERHTDVR